MKCLKSIKTGQIIRVSEEKAHAATSEWTFIPKSEWKAQFKVEPKVETGKVFADKADKVITVKREETISEKQLKRKKAN